MSEGHFDPATYREWIREQIPNYDVLQNWIAEAAAAAAIEPGAAILDLGTGTGETLFRVLSQHPDARAYGLDESEGMLDVARIRLVGYDVTLRQGDLRDELPPGPFDLVVSALAVHHLDGREKAALFQRVAAVLSPGGRFALGDVVLPEEAVAAVIPLTDGYDKPSTVADQLRWLSEAGLAATLMWQEDDLAFIVANRSPDGHE
jgi:tRNA (cmo5U34)-methyltransferase